MKNEMNDLAKKVVDIANKPISRKDAIKKTGLIAISAATMMILLGSPKAQACSPAPEQNDNRQRNDNRHRSDDHHRNDWGNEGEKKSFGH